MRKHIIAVALVLAVAGCWQQEINGWDFGPLQGQWAGTFSYADDSHLWQVLIDNKEEATRGSSRGATSPRSPTRPPLREPSRTAPTTRPGWT